jgi:hypothetical protein
MIVAAHQPNFLPWLGYFVKMNYADHFIFADDVQFTKPSFTNRVRIKTAIGHEWLTVPVITKEKGLQNIKHVKIYNTPNWRHKQWKTLFVNYKNAPYFEKYADFFNNVYLKNWKYLIDFNIHLIEYIYQELNISSYLGISSNNLSEITLGATEHIINMVKSVKGDIYISGLSGRKYLREDLFETQAIELKYFTFDHPQYKQKFEKFIANLSIIDLLFNEGPNAETILKSIKVKLETYQLKNEEYQS